MTSDSWLAAPPIEGHHVRLEPLTADHAAPLARHYDPDIFKYLSRGAPQDASESAMRAYIHLLNAEANRVNWAVLIRRTGDVAGRISYTEIRPAHRALEIGTMLMGPFHGSFVNPEAKLLLLRRAFETLGAVRVQFKTDARNERSQRALAKLGATREGVLRKYQTRPDGYVRDSVVYSILDDEWPQVRSKLEARLAAFETHP